MSDESKMKAYIGTGIVQAEPMWKSDFQAKKGVPRSVGMEGETGYLIAHSDGHESWLSHDEFRAAYRLVSDDERRMV